MKIFVLATVCSIAASAQGPGMPPPPPREPTEMRQELHGGSRSSGGPWLEELDLTEMQRNEIRKLEEKRQPSLEKLRRSLEDKEGAVREALDDPSRSESQLQMLHTTASEARLRVLVAEHQVAIEINAILTPEQKIKAHQLRERFSKLMSAQGNLDELAGPRVAPPAPRR